jgi:small subunit ribosomal protein S4e
VVKKHLKRLPAPDFWKIKKKEAAYVAKPRAGPHKIERSIPLQVLLRDFTQTVDTGTDAKKMIKMGEVHVDGRPRKDQKYPTGFMDVISIPGMKKDYRVIIDYKGLKVIDCPSKESKKKLVKIIDKSLIKRGQLQLNTHDGRNIPVKVKNAEKPKEDVYKSGDSLVIELPNQKILEHLKFEKGNLVLITGGQNKGTFAKIKEIITTRSREPNKVLCEKDGKEFEAIKDYIFVVGKNKPIITLEGD